MSQRYNEGGSTSSAGVQLNDFHFSRIAVLEAAKKKYFTQLGVKRTQPKHFGKTMKKYHEYPILHEANINDQGIDANGVTMEFDKWYSWTDPTDATTRQEHATKAEAKARVGQVRIQSGQGNLYGGSRDFNTQVGAFPILGEENTVANVVGTKRDVITATLKRYGFGIKYTKAAMELDTDAGLLIKQSQKIGEAYGEIREALIRNELITQGRVNATYSGAASAIDEVDETCELTYTDLRMIDQSLKFARCPIDTKIITGTTKIDTVTVGAATYCYVQQEMVPTLEDLTHNGKIMWQDVAQYSSGAGATATPIAEGEIGRIGRFRFIVVYDMPVFQGEGADATDGADGDGDGIEDAGANMNITDGHYDVMAMLFVGSGAFETMGLEGDIARVVHAKPRANPDTDMYGDKGSMSIAWYQAMIINRPEWIRTHMCSAKVA